MTLHQSATTRLLDRYFDRIGHGGSAAPTYETLRNLLAAHMAAIPFENVDVLLGRGIRLDAEGLHAKLIDARRGGYCFEHATLFADILEALGFAPVRHLARVTIAVPRDVAPRTHMLLTVTVDDRRHVVDPGFGAMAPRVPVPVVASEPADAADESHWLERNGHEWTLKMQLPDRIADCWVTTFERENPLDFAIANHYTATHPESSFVNRIMLRALLPDGRVTAHNRDVTITRGRQAVTSQLADRKALRELLATHFGFDLPEIETLRVPTIPEWS